MSTGEVYLQALFHIIMVIVVLAIFGEAILCHLPFSVAPSYDIGAGFLNSCLNSQVILCDRADGTL